MMAFFLLLWLISMTTPEQKQGPRRLFRPAEYQPRDAPAAPAASWAARRSTPTGEQDGGLVDTSTADPGRPTRPPITRPAMTSMAATGAPTHGKDGTRPRRHRPRRTNVRSEFEEQEFHSAAASIRPGLAGHARHHRDCRTASLVEQTTDEGLNIQLIDQEGRPMFPEEVEISLRGDPQGDRRDRADPAASCPTRSAFPAIPPAGSTYDNPHYGAVGTVERPGQRRCAESSASSASRKTASTAVVGKRRRRAVLPQRPVSVGPTSASRSPSSAPPRRFRRASRTRSDQLDRVVFDHCVGEQLLAHRGELQPRIRRGRCPGSSRSKILPWRTDDIPSNPRLLSEPVMAWPCGSRTPDLRVTVTRAFIDFRCRAPDARAGAARRVPGLLNQTRPGRQRVVGFNKNAEPLRHFAVGLDDARRDPGGSGPCRACCGS